MECISHLTAANVGDTVREYERVIHRTIYQLEKLDFH
jgi:hypothetical protein